MHEQNKKMKKNYAKPHLQTTSCSKLDFQNLDLHTGDKRLIHGTKHYEINLEHWNIPVENTHLT